MQNLSNKKQKTFKLVSSLKKIIQVVYFTKKGTSTRRGYPISPIFGSQSILVIHINTKPKSHKKKKLAEGSSYDERTLFSKHKDIKILKARHVIVILTWHSIVQHDQAYCHLMFQKRLVLFSDRRVLDFRSKKKREDIKPNMYLSRLKCNCFCLCLYNWDFFC